jgi:signal transduction histidine kinase
MSLLPHFILKPVKDRGLVIVTLLVYLGLSLFIDNIMINLSSRSETIIPIIEKNRFYYNLIPAVFFVFINIALILLFNQNAKYEKILQEQRSTLLEQNTDLENTLNQLHQAQAQLIQSEKLAALGTLTAGVAHEINNPLNFISVSLQQIRNLIKDIESHSSIDKESFKEFSKTFDALLGFAEEGASRTSEIVKKLGTLKSIDNSKKSPTNLKKLIDSAYKLLFDSKIPELQYVNSLTENISIKCQKESLQKAFINIFTNANEAMNSTGRVKKCKIEVSGEMQTINKIEYITVSITNNGPAIPETELPYIFDPFFTTKQDKAANGLGLSEAYSIISQHDGSISAKNSNGHVIFKISLPIYNT